MSFHQRQTSLITILSSDHGRMRREERDIDKRDLQKALKHGTRAPCWGQRWKVEHDGIIFIVDNALRSEVTAYPAPLSLYEVTPQMRSDHEKAKLLISHKPDLCVSHTVLVVDNSGSMATHDIRLHRDRQTAAYTATALEFIAEQLFQETANNSDVVSLVEFGNTSKVVFKREPVTWHLYNMLLARRDSRGYQSRQSAMHLDALLGDSNYLPALEDAEKLLMEDDHEDCALSLFFLSDGAPTDASSLGLTPAAATRKLCEKVMSIATQFDSKLAVTLVGFGNSGSDFSTLEKMVEAVKVAPCNTRATFMYCGKMSDAIGEAVTSMVTSLTETRAALADAKMSRGRTKRNVSSEKDSKVLNQWHVYRICDHFLYHPRAGRLVPDNGLPPGAISDANKAEALARRYQPPPFLAMNRHSLGEGVERVAFRCQLSDSDISSTGFVLDRMVAKETNLVERIEENVEYHNGFCMTQDLASYLAGEFNQRLKALPSYNANTTPRICFLDCSVLLLEDPSWPGGLRGMLVEKMLDTDRFGWCKWNNNAGAVEGKLAHHPLDVDYELAKLNVHEVGRRLIGLIEEGDSDEESDDDDEDIEPSYKCSVHDKPYVPFDDLDPFDPFKVADPFQPSDYLQAFTHFTHTFTGRKVMVCDLQGVYNTDTIPPTFELTDPAIHYASKKGRVMVHGRTDKGRKGMDLFFKTHKCTDLCKLLQLSKKNKQWRKEWHHKGASR